MATKGRDNQRIFFIYDHTRLQREEDDIKDALLYPEAESDEWLCMLCGQLMGMVEFLQCTISAAAPKVIKLQKEMFVFRRNGNYTYGLQGIASESESPLLQQLDHMLDTFTMYHGSIDCLRNRYKDNYPTFRTELQKIWDIILSHTGMNSGTFTSSFQSLHYVDLPKSGSHLFLQASHILQSSQRRPYVLAGAILYKEGILCTQLPPDLTRKLTMMHSRLPCIPLKTEFELPKGCKIVPVFLKDEVYSSLHPMDPVIKRHCKVTDFTSRRQSDVLSHIPHRSHRRLTYPNEASVSLNHFDNKSISDHALRTFLRREQKGIKKNDEIVSVEQNTWGKAKQSVSSLSGVPIVECQSGESGEPDSSERILGNMAVESHFSYHTVDLKSSTRKRLKPLLSETEESQSEAEMHLPDAEKGKFEVRRLSTGSETISDLDNTSDPEEEDKGKKSETEEGSGKERKKPHFKLGKVDENDTKHVKGKKKKFPGLELHSDKSDMTSSSESKSDGGSRKSGEETTLKTENGSEPELDTGQEGSLPMGTDSEREDIKEEGDGTKNGNSSVFETKPEESLEKDSVDLAASETNEVSILKENAVDSCKIDVKLVENEHNFVNSKSVETEIVSETENAIKNEAESPSDECSKLEKESPVSASPSQTVSASPSHTVSAHLLQEKQTICVECSQPIQTEENISANGILSLTESDEKENVDPENKKDKSQSSVSKQSASRSYDSNINNGSKPVCKNCAIKARSPSDTAKETIEFSSSGNLAERDISNKSLSIHEQNSTEKSKYGQPSTYESKGPNSTIQSKSEHSYHINKGGGSNVSAAEEERRKESMFLGSFSSDRSTTSSLSKLWTEEMDGLNDVTLYVQCHSDISLILLMENPVKYQENLLHSLWRGSLPHLADLDFFIKECIEQSNKESFLDNYCYLKFDCLSHDLTGNVLEPVTGTEYSFQETASSLHQDFTDSQCLTDVTLRSQTGCYYGHRSLVDETYFQLSSPVRLTSGLPLPRDPSFSLDQEAKKRLAKGHNVTIV